MSRKQQQNIVNYNREMKKLLAPLREKIEEGGAKPRLLLHACCAPCSSAVLEILAPVFDITIYYYNPNIHPAGEYQRRLQELRRYLKSVPAEQQAELEEAAYVEKDYYDATRAKKEIYLQTEAEKGERCLRCYRFRMETAYNFAKDNGFPWFGTTLSISPFKDSQKINTIGMELDKRSLEEGEGPRYLCADFKKDGGFDRSLVLSEKYQLYRQEYCGCEYSLANAQKRAEEKVQRKKADEEEEISKKSDIESFIASLDGEEPIVDNREMRELNKKASGIKKDKARRERKVARR
jgi:predicted adenine nucleotide alpha hydrolase (AANH) superfamily ATPase